MKLILKQRLFSWLDSYDIYDEQDSVVYSVKGKLSFTHHLNIYDHHQVHIGTIKQELLSLMPRFSMFIHQQYIGCIYKKLSFFKPQFQLDCNHWKVVGNWLEWDYQIIDEHDQQIASISKDLCHFTDTYVLDIIHSQDALLVFMIVLAIDAEKCSHHN